MRAESEELESTGRVWLRDALGPDDLEALEEVFPTGTSNSRMAPSTKLATVLGSKSNLARALHNLLPNAFPTRVVAFSKSADANWVVPWHQDRVIAVNAKQEISGYDQWSCKDGIWHCAPPEDVLAAMLFVRLHLDDDVVGNGAMEIALGSHKRGKVDAGDAGTFAEDHEVETCHANRGDVLLLKMLTLHRSSPSRKNAPRRVLRCDYANSALPTPLAWTGWSDA